MKILFVNQRLATFVKKDLDILSENHTVHSIYFNGLKDIFDVYRQAKWCDITYSWFCSPHAFFTVLLSKVLGKKSVVVAGGYDVVNAPDIKYGVYFGSSPIRILKQIFSMLTFKMVDLVLCVSKSNAEEAINNAKVHPDKIRLVYHGFNHVKYSPMDTMMKEQIALTVGDVSSSTSLRKGHDLFVKSAAYLPHIQFVIVGKEFDDYAFRLKKDAPENVSFLGNVSNEKLLENFRRSKVYVQTSRHEGFGCAVAEAMLCECVPVVARRTALPEVVGDCGFYVDELTPESVADKIKEALSTGNDMGKNARKRIMDNFTEEKRGKELNIHLEDLTGLK